VEASLALGPLGRGPEVLQDREEELELLREPSSLLDLQE